MGKLSLSISSSSMKLCAVTVWYNPQNIEDNLSAAGNLKSVLACPRIERAYVIDNSFSSNENLISSEFSDRIIYVPLYKNIGIAAALNRGCCKAIEDGFDTALTMDQDSYWNIEQLEKYISDSEKIIESDPSIKSFGPNMNDPVVLNVLALLKRKVLGRHYKNRDIQRAEVEFPNYVMCSGNIISLDTWNKIGRFDEKLFIDEVDHDYCFRLLKHGYKIRRNNKVFLNHHLGDKKRTFFPRALTHHGIRIYYIFRNMIIVNHRYPEYTAYTISDLKRFTFDSVFFNIHAVKNIINILKAIRDAKKIIREEDKR